MYQPEIADLMAEAHADNMARLSAEAIALAERAARDTGRLVPTRVEVSHVNGGIQRLYFYAEFPDTRS